MNQNDIGLHFADRNELDAINHVVEDAVLSWDLPDRVKRLSLPSYRYTALDLLHLDIIVAEISQAIVGVAAWEPADPGDTPDGRNALLLHGIFVTADWHGAGIGTLLFQAAEQATHEKGLDGLLVKAQAGADGFFKKQGMIKLPVDDPNRHLENRFWKARSAT